MGNSDSLLQCLLFFQFLLPAIWIYCAFTPPKEWRKMKPGSRATVEEFCQITYWATIIFNLCSDCSPFATDNKETALMQMECWGWEKSWKPASAKPLYRLWNWGTVGQHVLLEFTQIARGRAGTRTQIFRCPVQCSPLKLVGGVKT